MILYEQKLIFIHVPKTAGCAITHLFLSKLLNKETSGSLSKLPQNIRETYELDYSLKHATAIEIAEYLPEKSRNDYYKTATIRNPWDRTVSAYHWIKSKELPNLSFNEYVNMMYKYTNDKSHKFAQMFQPQTSYFTSHDGEVIVDYVIRFENLQEGVDLVGSKVGINFGVIKKHNVTRKRKHYREYYTSETQDIVHECCINDIELFDYKF